MQDSFTASLSATSILVRTVCLLILVGLFQVFIAHAPTVRSETKRRWQHALTGHALVQISYVLPPNVAIAFLIVATASVLIVRVYFFESVFLKAVGPLLRPEEINGAQYLPGAFYFLLGTVVTIVIVNDWMIARYAVECLAFADPMASWIGSTVPSMKITKGTSVSGCFACFITAWIVGWFMLGNDDGETVGAKKIYTTISIGALACTVAEGLPVGNDNLNIPVFTALAVQLLG
jgi:dolichol kinase